MKVVVSFLLLILSISNATPQSTNQSAGAAAIVADDKRKDPPPDFKGDGCSKFPDGDYEDCCFAHDKEYYRGGTKAERRAADKRLAQCVRAKGHKYISRMMYLGVRVGGMAFLPTSFRWGFGQPKSTK
jgi:hypothetical protein